MVRHSGADNRRTGALRGITGASTPEGNRVRLLTRILIACSVLVVAFGGIAAMVLVRAGDGDRIPVVTDISARLSGGSVAFGWDDPGLTGADSYQIALDRGDASQQTTPTFVVDAEPGEHVCITVRVSRAGTLGDPSNPKCLDVPG